MPKEEEYPHSVIMHDGTSWQGGDSSHLGLANVTYTSGMSNAYNAADIIKSANL